MGPLFDTVHHGRIVPGVAVSQFAGFAVQNTEKQRNKAIRRAVCRRDAVQLRHHFGQPSDGADGALRHRQCVRSRLYGGVPGAEEVAARLAADLPAQLVLDMGADDFIHAGLRDEAQ